MSRRAQRVAVASGADKDGGDALSRRRQPGPGEALEVTQGNGGRDVPLSEDEERILNQIEQRFYTSDPQSARRIGRTTLPRYLARNCRWAAISFVVGLLVLLASFASSWVVGVVGFVMMVVAAIVFTQNLRKMGRHGWNQLNNTVRERSVNDVLGDTGRRFRRRFGNER